LSFAWRALDCQALSEQSSTHVTRHAATSPVLIEEYEMRY